MPASAAAADKSKSARRRPATTVATGCCIDDATGCCIDDATGCCIDDAIGRWSIDALRSTLRVSVKVGLFATVHGTFADVTGHVDVAADPSRSRVEVAVATGSLSSGSSCVDALLHGAGVVDSARNPSISFVSRAIRAGAEAGTWFLDGLLATNGAVLDVTLEMSDPIATGGALLFRATGSLPSKEAVRLLSQQGVERVLGRTMGLDLTIVAVPGR
ncbi:polyisoprenoid-binding protein YceI [Nakamurella sp. UYEF19]|uniref:YceI family protein n=1 Tax=Nakamurella sp. UYEF19 TaxID=1756392 RepID=UPI003399D7F2